MLRRFLFPLLAIALLATEAAQAQATAATPPTKATRQAYRKARKAERVLTKREQQAAEAAARVQAAKDAIATTAQAPAGTTWSGWSDDPLPTAPATAPGRAVGNNVSVAPGMPLNQVGHGVSTDYNGRPLTRPVAGTTLGGIR